MFGSVLKRPLQTVAQNLRDVLRRFVIQLVAAAVVFLGLEYYWSTEPTIFDVREVALRQSGGDPKKLVHGAVTTATLMEVASTLLDKRGGLLSNDINPVSRWLDNIPNWEYGVLIQVRDLARVLRNDFSRSQTQSVENRHLARADPHLHFKHESWIFPTSESH